MRVLRRLRLYLRRSMTAAAMGMNLCWWFELAVFRGKDVAELLERDGQLLAWRIHGNRTDLLDTTNSVSRHFGVVFDWKQVLLLLLFLEDLCVCVISLFEVGNVIVFRVCAKYSGRVNGVWWSKCSMKVSYVYGLDNLFAFCWTSDRHIVLKYFYANVMDSELNGYTR